MEQCAAFLQKQHIRFLEEWLEACIEWIVEENQGKPSNDDLVNLVYEQWLMADLEEISEPCLPSNLKQKQNHSTLSGSFSLQINYFLDIGHSAYSQFLKLSGEEVVETPDDEEEDNGLIEFFSKSNSEKSVNKPKNQNWKTKQSRMFFFELTDGTNLVEAIEYQSFTSIKTEDVSPGGKVMISGSIKCFDGVLLLKNENIKYLGGNCERLLESNAQHKVLSQILKIDPEKKSKVKNPQSGGSVVKKEENISVNQTSTITHEIKSRSNTNPVNRTRQQVVPEDDMFSDDDIFIPEIEFDIPTTTVNSKKSTTKLNNRQSKVINKQPIKIDETFQDKEPDDLFNDSFDDFEVDKKTPICNNKVVNKDISENIFQCDDWIDPPEENTDNVPVATISLTELISYKQPILYMFSVAGWFKTLSSKLCYEKEFHILAIVTDQTKTYVQVLLGDEVLTKLIGFTATEVNDAAQGNVPQVRKQFIKQAIANAEKSLKEFSGEMHIVFDSKNEIYKVVNLISENI